MVLFVIQSSCANTEKRYKQTTSVIIETLIMKIWPKSYHRLKLDSISIPNCTESQVWHVGMNYFFGSFFGRSTVSNRRSKLRRKNGHEMLLSLINRLNATMDAFVRAKNNCNRPIAKQKQDTMKESVKK